MILVAVQAIEQLDAAKFAAEGKTGRTFMTMFYISECATCEAIERELDFLDSNLTHIVRFYKIDCDKEANKPVCAKHSAEEFPLLKLFNVKDANKGKVYAGKKSRDNLRQFLIANHRKPFVHLKGADNSAASVVQHQNNALYILTPSTKAGVFVYKIADLLQETAVVVLNSNYNEDAFYRFKGSDLVDYLSKDPVLQVVAHVDGRYTVYSGDGDSASIEQWVQREFNVQ